MVFVISSNVFVANITIWFALVYGLVWSGLVWFGLVWFGLVWFGLVKTVFTSLSMMVA